MEIFDGNLWSDIRSADQSYLPPPDQRQSKRREEGGGRREVVPKTYVIGPMTSLPYFLSTLISLCLGRCHVSSSFLLHLFGTTPLSKLDFLCLCETDPSWTTYSITVTKGKGATTHVQNACIWSPFVHWKGLCGGLSIACESHMRCAMMESPQRERDTYLYSRVTRRQCN